MLRHSAHSRGLCAARVYRRGYRQPRHRMFRSPLSLVAGLTMKWITRERVKVDRVACPWLIRKFIDPEAKFAFVPADDVVDFAKREGAIPFDVPNVEFGHHGKECSFDALVKKHGLGKDPAVTLMAKIVNGADTD